MLLKKKSFIILNAIVFVLFPILFFIYLLYNISISNGTWTIAQSLKYHFLPFYDLLSETIKIPENLSLVFFSTRSMNYYRYFIIPILSIIGILRFQKTGSLRILHGLLIVIFFEKINSLFSVAIVYIKYPDYKAFSGQIIELVVSLLASIFSLIYIRSKLSFKISADKETPIDQDLSTRFLNMILDQIVIIFLTFASSDWFLLFMDDSDDLKFMIYFQICYSFQFLLYYFILEGCFKSTVGKVVTYSTIVNSKVEFISMGNAFIRTLCRFIPFEPFSFLIGKRGWHDTVSDTYVVNSFYKNDE